MADAMIATASSKRPLRILLVSSSGGHLAQLVRLRDWSSRHDCMWVTFQTVDAVTLLREARVAWAFHPTTRNLPNLLRNLRLARRVFTEFSPDLVISTGAGVAVPFFWLAWLRRVRTVYLEVFDRIDTPTLTGRLCRPVADLFLVQWQEQQGLYAGSVVLGKVF